MRLGKDVFLALSAIIWADGVVTGEERTALVEAARACELTADELAEVEASTHQKVPVDRLSTLKLGGDLGMYVYAIAAWLAQADGEVSPEESDALGALSTSLGLSEPERLLAAAAGLGVASFDDEDHAPGDAGRVLALARAIRSSAEQR